tara:strand:+ start:1546 stop:1749 length:204 start_codon:yes stop_codon:yes gene_type:complete
MAIVDDTGEKETELATMFVVTSEAQIDEEGSKPEIMVVVEPEMELPGLDVLRSTPPFPSSSLRILSK